jgi:O6-methylguanine-DNA--protein-cysteine methyltransferase
MNLIQDQATRFYEWKFNEYGNYQEFISEVRTQLDEYRKDAHKLEFLDYLMTLLKQEFDKHLEVCQHKNEKNVCDVNKNFENSLFFIENERDEVIEYLPKTEFNLKERSGINDSLQKILEDLNKIKIGQEFTYDDIVEELNELKEFYFLNKKHWSQMFIGRLSEMVAGGVISETISKEIVETVLKNYGGIIQ